MTVIFRILTESVRKGRPMRELGIVGCVRRVYFVVLLHPLAYFYVCNAP